MEREGRRGITLGIIPTGLIDGAEPRGLHSLVGLAVGRGCSSEFRRLVIVGGNMVKWLVMATGRKRGDDDDERAI